MENLILLNCEVGLFLMSTKFKRIGYNAGKIWSILNEKGPLTKSILLKYTKLSNYEFYSAVGWLARENKITLDNEYYKLDTTNLTPEIGTTAGKIWKIIDIWDEVEISTIKKLAAINEKDLYSAIGWLAREDKIYPNGSPPKFRLK